LNEQIERINSEIIAIKKLKKEIMQDIIKRYDNDLWKKLCKIIDNEIDQENIE
jgi:hypothetical protein